MLIKSLNDVKIYYIAAELTGSFGVGFSEIESLYNAVADLVDINGKCLLESFSHADRKQFAGIITSHASGAEDLKKDDIKRAIRLASLSYIYDNSHLGEYSGYMQQIMLECKSAVFGGLKITSEAGELSLEESDYFKAVFLEDLACTLGKFAKEISTLGKSNSYVYSDFFINEFPKQTVSQILEEFKDVREFAVERTSDVLGNVAHLVCEKLKNIVNAMHSKINGIDLEMLRKREQMVIEREIDVEKKSKVLDEMLAKNKEFSLDLQKKAREIESKMNSIAVQRSEFESMLNKITDLCKNVIETRKKIV